MDLETARHVARLARLELPPETLAEQAGQLTDLLGHFESLNELDLQGVEPAVYAVDLRGATRPDEVEPSPPRAELLERTEHHREGFFVVPRVIE